MDAVLRRHPHPPNFGERRIPMWFADYRSVGLARSLLKSHIAPCPPSAELLNMMRSARHLPRMETIDMSNSLLVFNQLHDIMILPLENGRSSEASRTL